MTQDNEQAKAEEVEAMEDAAEQATDAAVDMPVEVVEEAVEQREPQPSAGAPEPPLTDEAAELLGAEELLDDAPAAVANRPVSVADAANPADGGKKKSKVSAATVVLAIVAVAACIVAIASFVINRAPDGAAAKIGDNTYLAESDVTAYIDNYRTQYSMTEDADWASALSQQSLTPSSWRVECIETLAKNEIISAEAEKQNCAPTDEEVQEQIDTMKSSMGITDDETWASTLQQYGYTEDDLKDEVRVSTAKSNLLAAAVPKPEGYEEAQAAAQNVETDSDGNAKKKKEQTILDNANDLYTQWQNDCTAYISNLVNRTSLTIYPMPSGLSYDVDLSLANSTDDSSTDDSSSDSSSSE